MDNRIALYQKRLSLQNAAFERINHADAMVAIVYKVTPTIGAPLILKICNRVQDYNHERYFLTYFASKLPVPRIIDVVPPEKDLDGAILMEWLPGNLLSVANFTDQLAHEIGSLLAQIHLNRVAGYGDLTKPYSLSPDARDYFLPKFQENIAECEGHLPMVLIEQCRTYYDTHSDLLMTVDGPCIIHRDFRPGNIIVNDNIIQGIIDWSSARAGFAQEDFCSLEHQEWSSNAAIKKSFLDGYASMRPIPEYAAIMPLLRMNKALATIGFTLKRGTWNNSHASLYQFNRDFLETLF